MLLWDGTILPIVSRGSYAIPTERANRKRNVRTQPPIFFSPTKTRTIVPECPGRISTRCLLKLPETGNQKKTAPQTSFNNSAEYSSAFSGVPPVSGRFVIASCHWLAFALAHFHFRDTVVEVNISCPVSSTMQQVICKSPSVHHELLQDACSRGPCAGEHTSPWHALSVRQGREHVENVPWFTVRGGVLMNVDSFIRKILGEGLG